MRDMRGFRNDPQQYNNAVFSASESYVEDYGEEMEEDFERNYTPQE